MLKKINAKYSLATSIALLTFLVYLPALRNEFVYWDDNLYIFENPHIRSLDFAFFRWAFFGFHVSNWHPLTWISHALDYAIWGMNPLGHHLTNIILHAINTALVVLLALKLLDIVLEKSEEKTSGSFLNNRTIMIAAAVTGLLFGIHPLHVESVAWVAERKDLLCALFFLLSIMMYVNAVMRREHSAEGREQSGENKGLTLCAMRYALFFFTLALLSKPMAVSLPVVLLILDWYPLDRIRSWKALWPIGVEKLPFIAFSLASSILTIFAQKVGGAVVSSDVVPFFVRTLLAAKSLVAYIVKMIVPLDLIPFYPYPSYISFEYLLSLTLAIGISVACVSAAKKGQRAWLMAWGYYFVTLLPVLGIIQVGAQAMADRYTYLPSLGPFLIIGSVSTWLFAKVQERWLLSKHFLGVAAILIIAMLCSFTVRQIRIWGDSITLWSYELQKVPDANTAYVNRGNAFMKLGQYDKALKDYNEAISRKPSDYKAFYSRGLLFEKLNLVYKAIADYSAAIALKPSFYDAYNNRGLLFDRLGQPDKAMTDYDTAISINPSNYQPYLNRGQSFDKAGQSERALADFDQAVSLNPSDPDVWYNRGLFFSKAGQLDRALSDLNHAMSLNPNDPDAYYNRGMVYQKMGQVDKANRDFMVWKEYSARH